MKHLLLLFKSKYIIAFELFKIGGLEFHNMSTIIKSFTIEIIIKIIYNLFERLCGGKFERKR